jgi:hypothetical protein
MWVYITSNLPKMHGRKIYVINTSLDSLWSRPSVSIWEAFCRFSRYGKTKHIFLKFWKCNYLGK